MAIAEFRGSLCSLVDPDVFRIESVLVARGTACFFGRCVADSDLHHLS